MGNCLIRREFFIRREFQKEIKELSKCSTQNTEKFLLTGNSMFAKVIDVYDGDTITVAFKFQKIFWQHSCRIYGLDCAEIRTKNLEEKKVGLEAKNFLSNLILGKVVWLDVNKNKDKFGRLLATVKLNKEDTKTIADIMIEKNFGYAYKGAKKEEFENWYENQN